MIKCPMAVAVLFSFFRMPLYFKSHIFKTFLKLHVSISPEVPVAHIGQRLTICLCRFVEFLKSE